MMTAEPERRNVDRRTDDIYRRAIEEIADFAIFMTDTSGSITNWNLGAQSILGYSEDEVLGQNIRKFFTPEDRARNIPQAEFETAIEKGRAEDERWHLRRNGSRFWASGIVTPVLDSTGNLIGFSKIMRDMTERNKLTEERDRFFALSMDMLCIVNLDGRFQRVNPAFQEALGFSEEELMALKIFELIHPDDLDATHRLYESLKEGNSVSYMENRLRRADGTYCWVAWSYFPVPEDGLAFGVGRDVTIMRQMHEALRQRADELETANRVKDEFMATMSHELRTPLTSILGWSRLLRSSQLNEEDKERAVTTIQRNAEAQAKLIDDLLDLSRIIAGKLRIEFEPVSFAAIVESVVSSFQPAIESKNLKFVTSIETSSGAILGDPARLQQITTNLFSNAIKFTPNGGTISVRVSRVDSLVRLEVSDTGIGIAAEHLPHIFEQFRQVDSSSMRAHGGLGLGLAIVEHLVRQQGGRVTAESEGIGKGATFVVEFPVMAEAKSVPMAELFAPETLHQGLNVDKPLVQRKILVVEDEDDARELLKAVLERQGAEVETTESGEVALQKMDLFKPDLLISDIGMAGENGYELIRRVRALPPDDGGRIPAIALTAYASASDRRRALLAGFQAHLAKPIDTADLVAVILGLTFHPEIDTEQEHDIQ